MNCPVCEKTMEFGELVTDCSRGLFFLPPGGKIGLLMATRKGFEKQNGVALDGPYHTNFPNETRIAAHICRSCRKMMLDY